MIRKHPAAWDNGATFKRTENVVTMSHQSEGWIEIRVAHTPAPQGSKVGFVRAGGKGAGTREANKHTEPYRQAVRNACEIVLEQASDRTQGGVGPLDGPLEAHCVFTMPKPKSAPKTRTTWPSTKPDIDKLLRSSFDAMTQSGLIQDDARIVKVLAEKCFPGEHPLAFSDTGTGAVIRVRRLT